MDKMNLKTKLFRTGMTFFAFWPSTSFSQEKVAYKPPLEMMCTVQNEKALHCVYDDGTTRKVLNDQDLIAFINQANKGAYVTVKSRKGFERVFFIDPNGAEFKTFYRVQKTPGISMREVGQAKYAVFAAIENKAITISKTLDSGGALPLVNADPANAYYQYKDQLKALKKEKDDLDLSYQKLKESSSEKNLEAALQEKQYFSHYLSDLVKLLGETGSCAEEFQLKPGADGSVNLDHLNDLAPIFQKKCHKKEAPAVVARNDLGTYQKYNREIAATRESINCEKAYDQGPFVVSGGNAMDRPFCFGVALCEKDKGKKEKTTVSCAATVNSGHYVCPAADHCGQDKDVFVFNKEVQVE